MDLNRLRILSGLEPINESEELNEVAPTDQEEFVKSAKADFKKRYGKRWKEVLYATAWKKHKNEAAEDDFATGDAIANLLEMQEISGIKEEMNFSGDKKKFFVYSRCARKSAKVTAADMYKAVKAFAGTDVQKTSGNPVLSSQSNPVSFIDSDGNGCEYVSYQLADESIDLDAAQVLVEQDLGQNLDMDAEFKKVHGELADIWPSIGNKWRSHLKNEFEVLAAKNKKGYQNSAEKFAIVRGLDELSLEITMMKNGQIPDLQESLADAERLANRGRGDNPAKTGNHDSEFPKTDDMPEPKDGLDDVTDVEFNDDKVAYNKLMTGQDIEQGTKVDVPSYVTTAIDKRIKELTDSIERWDEKGYDQEGAIFKNSKHNALDLLAKFKELLAMKDVSAYKEAQTLYGTLSSPIFDLLPTQLINFLHNGHNEPKKKI